MRSSHETNERWTQAGVPRDHQRLTYWSVPSVGDGAFGVAYGAGFDAQAAEPHNSEYVQSMPSHDARIAGGARRECVVHGANVCECVMTSVECERLVSGDGFGADAEEKKEQIP